MISATIVPFVVSKLPEMDHNIRHMNEDEICQTNINISVPSTNVFSFPLIQDPNRPANSNRLGRLSDAGEKGSDEIFSELRLIPLAEANIRFTAFRQLKIDCVA